MNKYNIRKLESNEFDLLIPLMKDCFGMKVDVSYFEWKFLKNPTGPFIGFVAVDENGEIGAYYGVIPELYNFNGNKRIIYQSCDTMTHSNHRRKGLFQKTATHCYEYLKETGELFVIGFGGGQSTPGFLKMGWKQPFFVKYFFNPIIPFSLFRQSEKIREAKISEVLHLIPKSNHKGILKSEKDVDIYTWRLANPINDYKIIVYNNGSEVSSFVVYYLNSRQLILFDFFFATVNEGKALCRALKKIGRSSGCKAIVHFCQEHSQYANSLRKSGFFTNPFKKGPLSLKVPFIFYATQTELEQYNNAELWEINAFDHDSL